MFQNQSHKAIGIFDSGVGGLTVMKQIIRAMPNEKIVYFGDTARFPYGGKSRDTILRYSIENAIFLMEQNVKMIVIACNTASAFAAEKLKQVFNIPVVDVISPSIERAVKTTKNGHIAILGTKGTIQSGIYQKEISQKMPSAEVTGIACPLWAPLVEELFINHSATKAIVQEYLIPLKNKKVDTLVLACTHYPLLRHLIEEEIDRQITIIDPAEVCAEKILKDLSMLTMNNNESQTEYQYYVSDDPEKFRTIGKNFLGMALHQVESVAKQRHFEQ